MSAFDHLRVLDQNGLGVALDNLFRAGVEVVRGLVDEWACTFASGLPAPNYIGDIFGSLGGRPDFGPGSIFAGPPSVAARRRPRP